VIRRSPRERNFTCIPNQLIEDPSIGWRDLGLIVYLLSKPDHWEVSVSHLAKHRKSGRDAIYASLKRLRDACYIRLNKFADGSTEWIVFDKPDTDYPDQAYNNEPHADFPDQENPDKANQTQVSTDKEVKTEEEVMSGKPDDAAEILKYLNLKTGSKFKKVDSNLTLINARLKEGHSPAEVKQVIDRKVAEWGKDTQMAQFLRPSTLFGATKFNDYAGQVDTPIAKPMNGSKPEWAKLPYDDNQLWNHAKKHGLPDPGRTATNFEYRAYLRNVIEQRLNH